MNQYEEGVSKMIKSEGEMESLPLFIEILLEVILKKEK